MDLKIIETQNGGDLVKLPKDLQVIDGFQNMVYLGLFGGNVESSTPTQRIATEQAFDWWGNTLFFPNDTSLQMNSNTERALNTVALNSNGRTLIEKAVKKDLEFMSPFANVSVSVSLIGLDILGIAIKVVRLDNLEKRAFVYIWDKTINELIQDENAKLDKGGASVTTKIFDESFDFTFETIIPILICGKAMLELLIF